MYNGLESNHAEFEQNRASFEQGGGRTGFAKSVFLEIPRFDPFFCPSPRRWYGALPKMTLGESLSSLVYKGENRMALSFLVLENLKFSVEKRHFLGHFRFNTLRPMRWRPPRIGIICSVACRCCTVTFFSHLPFFYPFHSTRS